MSSTPPTPPPPPTSTDATTATAQRCEAAPRADFLRTRPLPRWPLFCAIPVAAALCLYFSVLGWLPLSEREVTPAWVVANDRGELRVADPDIESMDAISVAIAQQRAAVAIVDQSTVRYGVVLPVYEVHAITLRVRPVGIRTASTPPELATTEPSPQLRKLVVTHLAEQRPREALLSAVESDVHTTRIYWLNSLVVLLGVPLLLVLVGVALNTLLQLGITCAHNARVRTRLRRLDAHKCPACRYDIAGLPQPVTRCPECGSTWSIGISANKNNNNAPGNSRGAA
jgi:hypothetical protein